MKVLSKYSRSAFAWEMFKKLFPVFLKFKYIPKGEEEFAITESNYKLRMNLAFFELLIPRNNGLLREANFNRCSLINFNFRFFTWFFWQVGSFFKWN